MTLAGILIALKKGVDQSELRECLSNGYSQAIIRQDLRAACIARPAADPLAAVVRKVLANYNAARGNGSPLARSGMFYHPSPSSSTFEVSAWTKESPRTC